MPESRTPLLALLDEAYRGPAWHGPSLTDAVRGVTLAVATFRPGRGRPCVWDLLVHCAYWKHRVRQRLLGTHEPFTRPGGDWPGPPAVRDARAWRADRRLLEEEHRALVAAARALSPRSLNRRARGHRQTPREMLVGIALHDTYHAGQIRALRKQARVSRR